MASMNQGGVGSNGDIEGNHIPPSTLAAQIVNNQNGPKEEAVFLQLLKEIRASPSALDDDIIGNHKLITVVLEAGLHAIAADDHVLLRSEDVASHAIACLDVIEIAFTRSPAVLFHTEDSAENNPPLCLLLVAKLFILWQLDNATELRNRSEGLLLCLHTTLWNTRGYHEEARKVLQLYESCISDLSHSLRHTASSSMPSTYLPTAEACNLMCNNAHQPLIAKSGLQTPVTSPRHAITLQSSLLFVLSSIHHQNTLRPCLGKAFKQKSKYYLYQALAQIQKTLWNPESGLNPADLTGCCFQHLRVMCSVVQPMIAQDGCDVIFNKTSFLLVEHLSGILVSVDCHSIDGLRTQLIESMAVIMELTAKSDRLAERIRTKLFSDHVAIRRENGSFLELFGASSSITGNSFNAATNSPLSLNGGLDSNTEFQERPLKRRKRTQENDIDGVQREGDYDVTLKAFCAAVNHADTRNLGRLASCVSETLQNGSDEDQIIKILTLFARLPCSGALPISDTEINMRCEMCARSTAQSHWDHQHWKWFFEILSTFVQSRELQGSKDARILILVAVRCFANHTPIQEYLNLTKSTLGTFCLQGVRSSCREVRIVAINALPSFLRASTGMDDVVCRQDRVVALDLLQQMLDGDDSQLWESSVTALGAVAASCDDEEMNIVLLRLVECLGSTNSLMCSLARLELRNVASHKSLPLDELLRPFWRTIAISVIKDLPNRPQKAQQLADILGKSVDDLLIETQEETLPFLLLSKHGDTLQRIANARSPGGSIRDLCMQSRNLTVILANLLIQDPKHMESTVHSFLGQASPELRKVSASDLLKLDIVAVACELLKIASDVEGAAQKKILTGFLCFACIVEGDSRLGKDNAAQEKIKPVFFGKHVLGMMTTFSGIIGNPIYRRHEKRRCLKAMKLMLDLGRNDVAVALPQIRACLSSAIEISVLKDEAMIVWIALLKAFDSDEDLIDVIEHTFSVLLSSWSSLNTILQQEAYQAIGDLFKTHNRLIADSVLLLPSLQPIPLMAKFEAALAKFRNDQAVGSRIRIFAVRVRNENTSIVSQALRELVPFLEQEQAWLHDAITSEQPPIALSELLRALLDTCAHCNIEQTDIMDLCTTALGAIGCVDPVRIEALRDKQDLVVISNFETANEAVQFVSFMLDTVLVKAFHSAPNPRAQGFLAYVMQELLKFCGFAHPGVTVPRPRGVDIDDVQQHWLSMTESVRNTLTPLLSSRYVLTHRSMEELQQYPIYNTSTTHGKWLRTFVYDLLGKVTGDNAKQIFPFLRRVIQGYDTAISAFLLPFVCLNVIIGGTVREVSYVRQELYEVLSQPSHSLSPSALQTLLLCSDNVFQVLDYLSKWLQLKRRTIQDKEASSNSTPYDEIDKQIDQAQVKSIDDALSTIHPDEHSTRAVECGAYSRALLHWEQYIRQQREPKRLESMTSQDILREKEEQYHRLHAIYAEIDEPDGIEGISHYIQVFEAEEQILEHEKNGRWSAAQSWYESYVNDNPTNLDYHLDLMTCLQRAGQYGTVLDHGKNIYGTWPENEKVLSLMSEAAWSMPKRLPDMQDFLQGYNIFNDTSLDFNIGIGKLLIESSTPGARRKSTDILRDLRLSIGKSLSIAATTSLHSCHDQMMKLHTLYEIDVLNRDQALGDRGKLALHTSLTRRLDIIGAYLPDKQYLLSIRRAIMDINEKVFDGHDKSQLWLQTAKLARKGNRAEVAYNAVLNALQLGDESAKIEQARLLWRAGDHRKAIQSLEGAIESNAFAARGMQDTASMQAMNATAQAGGIADQNLLVAKANLLLAKWLDRAGQTQTSIINQKYQFAVKSYARWEKGLYNLGKFYNKLFEASKALSPSKQDANYLNGDCAKLVIENYLRSLVFGCKYLFETVPKLLTLWLDFGAEVAKPITSVSREVPDEIRVRTVQRRQVLDGINKQVRKYADKIANYLFYPALAQMLTRVCHPQQDVYEVLAHIITKVTLAYPQQALWPLLATAKSSTQDRANRGVGLLNKIKQRATKTIRNEGNSVDIKKHITDGQRLSEQLLKACEAPIGERTTGLVSLTRDLGFSKTVVPCSLVVPVEKALTASLPTVLGDYHALKNHKAFPLTKDAVTISSFTDDVLVLNSLQKPRKLTVRGTDGLKYGLLCKPKDDLRKDQRLMEFNAMVNRALKKDAECSKRRLYIRTYAVTPLNEECGIIEWVDGLKALRDIILQLYRSKGISVNYGLLRELLNEASAKPENHIIFTNQILTMYPSILHEWFTDTFSDPESWFTARLRYTRSAAVTSIVGNALGLGDRHGENVMLEEGTGGVFHVDFNCLFEKGLTFEKPELVPFRLTHNMVDAFGAYGVEGPFRRSAECTAKVMRSAEDALLTILETFVYDPTADFMGGGRRRVIRGVPETPKEILESVQGKLRGFLRGETVALGVEGHVDGLIRQATDPANLSGMYIGWLPML